MNRAVDIALGEDESASAVPGVRRSPRETVTRVGRRLLPAIPIVLTAWLYYPITRNYFFADDFVCLFRIINDGFLRFALRPFGGHNLLARNAVFYGSYHLFGLHAEFYMWTVFLTHLVNVWLLFRVVRNLTGSGMLACFGALLWGTSPFQRGTLEWYSVFGHVMAATCLLVVLERLTRLATAGGPLRTRTAYLWYALLLVGTTFFGVGVAFAGVFPLVLFLMLPAVWRRPGVRIAFLALPLVAGAGYVASRRLYALLAPLTFSEILAEPGNLRRFTLAAEMIPDLLAFSVPRFLASFLREPTALPTDSASVSLALFGIGLALVFWRGSSLIRRAALAMVTLCLASYFAVGLGRAVLATGNFPMYVLAGSLRYHYSATVPMAVAACLVIREVGRLGRLRSVPRAPLLVAAIALGTYGFLHSQFRITDYSRMRGVAERMRDDIARDVSRRSGAPVFLDNSGKSIAVLLGPMMQYLDFPGRAALYLLFWGDGPMDGRPVRFVERERAVLRFYRQWPDAPVAKLLVAPDEVAGP